MTNNEYTTRLASLGMRRKELCADVVARGNYWDAFDLGRLAYLDGDTSNPFRNPAHSAESYWELGRQEEAREALRIHGVDLSR